MIDKNDPNQNSQNHQDDPRVTAYVLGELSADEAREFEQAMQQSPHLATAVSDFRSTIQSLEIAFGDEPPMSLSDQQKSELDSAAVSGNELASKSLSTQLTVARPWLRWIMAAAIGGILIGSGFFLSGQRRDIAQHDLTFQLPAKPTDSDDATLQKDPSIATEKVTHAQQRAELELQLAAQKAEIEETERLYDEETAISKERLARMGINEEEFKKLAPLIESTIRADRWEKNESPTDEQRMLSESESQKLDDGYQSVDGIVGQFEMDEESHTGNSSERALIRGTQQRPALELNVAQQAGDLEGVVNEQAPAVAMSGEQFGYEDSETIESPLGGGIGGGGGGRSNEQEPVNNEPQERLAADSDRPTLRFLKRQSAEKETELRSLMQNDSKESQTSSETIEPYAANLSLIVEQQQGMQNKLAMSDSEELRAETYEFRASDNLPPAADGFLEKLSDRTRFKSSRFTDQLGEVPNSQAQPMPSSQPPATELARSSRIDDADEEMEKLDEGKSTKNDKPERAKEPLKKQEAPKTWKRVKAIPNTTRLMVGDKEELALTGMQVNVQVDGFRARVLIDYLYYNDRDRQLEGNFKLRLPDDSSLYYFAFGESANELTPQNRLAQREFIGGGTQFVSFTPAAITKSRTDVWRNVKEARMVPREQAAYAFRETVRKRVDPALVEWSGAGVFNAKVFPLAPKKVHRIVIGYDVNLTKTGDQLTYQLDLPESTGDCRIEINAQDIEGITYKIEPAAEPVEVAHNDQLHQRFTFEQRPEAGIRLTATTSAPLLLNSKELDDEFWATQITPELPVENAAGSKRALFLVDTSLSSSPDKINVWLKLLESTLANNRDSMKEFGVLFFSVDGHFWKPNYVANTPENLEQLKTTLSSLVLEGATDLYGCN